MLRLTPSHILKAVQNSEKLLLLKLRPVVGDWPSARNELRWLREETQKRATEPEQQHSLLGEYVSRRSGGEPLQYILGSTYFGELELKCRPGVLIPRPETAASVSYLVQSLLAAKVKRVERKDALAAGTAKVKKLNGIAFAAGRRKSEKQNENDGRRKVVRIYDLCSGSGCIPLLFWHEYYNSTAASQISLPQLHIVGFEASSEALQLARENHAMIESQRSKLRDGIPVTAANRQRAKSSLRAMKFLQANVLRRKNSPEELQDLMTLRQAIGQYFNDQGRSKDILKNVRDNDIWISNPPYISPKDCVTTKSQSVRDFEPKLALVPPETDTTIDRQPPKTGNEGDRFYEDILAQAMELRAKVVLFEVGDMHQAKRVAKMAVEQRHWHVFEIWRDEPSSKAAKEILPYDGKFIVVRGSGEGRSVLVCTRDGAALVGREPPSKELPSSDRARLPETHLQPEARSSQVASQTSTRQRKGELADVPVVQAEGGPSTKQPPAEQKSTSGLAFRKLLQQKVKEQSKKD